MTRLQSLILAGALFAYAAAPAQSATTIDVALLDMTSLASWSDSGGWGPGMMGQGRGWGGPGMMGPGGGWGGPGMMGPGGGWGMGMMGGGMMGHGMMSIRATDDEATAGEVTFKVTNWSRSVLHDLAIVAVDSSDASLPYDYNSWKVIEAQVKIVGETPDMAPNATEALKVDLKPGSYLLICNIPGHYAAGMAMPFTVKQ